MVVLKEEEEGDKWRRSLPSEVDSTNRTALGYAVLGLQEMFPLMLAWNIRKNMETPCPKMKVHIVDGSIEVAEVVDCKFPAQL